MSGPVVKRIVIKLENEKISLKIAPDHGGGLLSFDAYGQAVLRPASHKITAPTDLAAFVLVPYCNRLLRRTNLSDRVLQLDPTLAGEDLPLHGEGWTAAWQVEVANRNMVTLSFCHSPQGGDWPWRFSAEQVYTLAGTTLTHRLTLRNQSDEAMPAGLGFHPYFLRDPADRLYANIDGVWDRGASLMPTAHRSLDRNPYWPDGLLQPKAEIDHCFTGWDQHFQLERPGLTINVQGSDLLDHLHVFAPRQGAFLCVEPVSHPPNALTLAGARKMHLLQPEEVLSATLTYHIIFRD